MFGSSMLEVAIGLVLVYLLLSLICSAIQESLEAHMKYRASRLEEGLRELLQDKDGTQLLKQLYDHPMIFGLFRGKYDPAKVRSSLTSNLPTYIPPANFAVALIDTLVRGPVQSDTDTKAPPPVGEISIDSLRAAVVNGTTLNPAVQRVLLLALDSAKGDLAKAQASIEAWYNSGMERVSGRYKRQTQAVLLGLGLAVAIIFNVDSMRLASELYHNDALRAATVAQAEAVGKSEKPSATDVNNLATSINKLNLPIGWNVDNFSWYEGSPIKIAALTFFGWLLTAFAISFGAPFWFDLLNKLIVLRSTVKPQEKGAGAAPKAPETEEKQAASQPVAAAPAAASSATSPPALLDNPAFQPHEWTTGGDPQGGAL